MVECPSARQLERFRNNELSAIDKGAVAAHLQSCPSCRTALRLVPTVAGRPLGGEQPRPEFLAHLRELYHEEAADPQRRPTPVSEGEKPTLPPLPNAPETQNLLPQNDDSLAELTAFLSPAQARDELGRLERFRILQVLGRGGMGVVYLAEDPQLGRKVAVKAMLPHLAALRSSRERFLREARTAAALEHDHVVPIFHVGEDHAVPFIVMPLLRGETLDRRLKRDGALPIPVVLQIGREAALALAAAHARGLLHRDVKPSNVWLESREQPAGSGDPAALSSSSVRVKLLDFGLARPATADKEQLTHTGSILGTPGYMPPEQVNGQKLDARADLFSLGCVLYQMAVGQPAYPGEELITRLLGPVNTSPRPPHLVNPSIPEALSRLLLQLLAREPERRPATAQAVIERLDAVAREFAKTPPVPTVQASAWRRWLPAALVLLTVALGTIVAVRREKELPPPVDTGKPPAPEPLGEVRAFKGHKELTSRAAISPDGRRMLSGSKDKTLRLWDLDSGNELHKADLGTNVDGVAFSPDGRLALVGGGDNLVRLWDVESWQEIRQLKGHTGSITWVAFAPDKPNALALSSSLDGAVRLWNLETGQPAGVCKANDEGICKALFTPNGERILSSSWDNTIRLWDVGTQKEVRCFRDHNRPPEGLDLIGPDGRSFVSGSHDRTVRLWDLATGEFRILGRHEGLVHGISVSPTGRRLLSCAYDGDPTIRLWDLDKGAEIHSFKVPTDNLHQIVFCPDGRHAVSASGEGMLRLWRLPEPPPPPTPRDTSRMQLLVDADFSKPLTTGGDYPMRGFPAGEANEMKAEHKDGEWRYLSKKGPQRWLLPQADMETMRVGDFVLEAESRFVGAGVGSWILRFGEEPGEGNNDFHVATDGRVGIWSSLCKECPGNTIPWVKSPAMKASKDLNTVRLEVIASRVRVFVNGQFVAEYLEKYYRPSHLFLLVSSDRPPVDVRFRRIRLWRPEPGGTVPPTPREKPSYQADFRNKVAEFPEGKDPSCGYEGGRFHVNVGKEEALGVGTHQSEGNTYCEVTGRVASGKGGSWMVVLGARTYVEIRADGCYRLRRLGLGKPRILTHPRDDGWRLHKALRTNGEFNTVGVAVSDRMLTLYFNGKWAADVHDTPYVKGFLQLGASADKEPTRAEFQKVQVWRQPAP